MRLQSRLCAVSFVSGSTKNKWGAAISGSGEIERHGIESISDKDRTATIFDFMRIEWGGSNSLATAVLGAFPIISSRPHVLCIAATTILGTASRMSCDPAQ